MKRTKKQMLSVIIAIIMLLTSIQTSIFASEEDLKYPELSIGEMTVSLGMHPNLNVYTVTPTKDAVYRFSSYDEQWAMPWILLFDADYSKESWPTNKAIVYVDGNVYINGAPNFDATFDLEGGKTYYIGMASYDPSIECLIKSEILGEDSKAVEDISIKLKNSDWNVIYGEQSLGMITPYGYRIYDYDYIAKNLVAKITYSDGTSEEWTYSESNSMSYNGKTITSMISNNGFLFKDGTENWVTLTYDGKTSNKLQIPVRDSVVAQIEGFQLSNENEGIRTVFSVSDGPGTVTETGLIYGLSSCCSEEEMVINSSNDKVFSYASTQKGVLPVEYGDMPYTTSYVMTMKYGNMSYDYFTEATYVRAYAKYELSEYKNGVAVTNTYYVYSDVHEYTVFGVADALYQQSLMMSSQTHNYLFDRILSKCDQNYIQKDYVQKDDYTLIIK